MSAYTPGPWRQTGVNVRAGDALVAIAVDHWANERTGEAVKLANARLIAAAPELVDALQDAEFLLRKAGQILGPMQDSFRRSAADARAVLARVEATP